MLKFENNCGHVRIVSECMCVSVSGCVECGLSQRRLAAQYPKGLRGILGLQGVLRCRGTN